MCGGATAVIVVSVFPVTVAVAKPKLTVAPPLPNFVPVMVTGVAGFAGVAGVPPLEGPEAGLQDPFAHTELTVTPELELVPPVVKLIGMPSASRPAIVLETIFHQ